jgi:hypothetical protein
MDEERLPKIFKIGYLMEGRPLMGWMDQFA